MYEKLINRVEECPNTQLVCDTILTLPIHPYLTDEEVDNTCNIIMATI